MSNAQGAAFLDAMAAAWRDTLWWLCLLLGPIVWAGLYFVDTPASLALPTATVLLYGVLLYPVLEEWVFRGFVQSSLLDRPLFRHRLGPVSLANGLASMAFAASHLIAHSPLHAASVFLPSLVFGWAYERYRHVGPSIVLHAFYNAGYLCLFAG